MRRKLALSLALLSSAALGLTLSPAPAEAFCGFYVAGADAKLFANATMVVLMRAGKRTVLSMQNDYRGPPEAFAMVVPVPVVLQEGDVKVLRKDLFDRVDELAAPRLVEYWEQDPCGDYETTGPGNIELNGKPGGTGTGYGRGSAAAVWVEAEFAVGEYDVVILSATESNGLDTWLRANGYNIPAGAEPLLRPYVEQGSKFFVAKVDPSKVEFDANGQTLLSPLRFHYDSDEFALPVRLGLINAPAPPGTGTGAGAGKQDLIVHILSPETRYQLANYPNVTIPTNLEVRDHTRDAFGSFYAALFEHTLAQTPGAVVTEYAWSAKGCDPCPGPEAALTNRELLELGADVLTGEFSRPAVVSRVERLGTEVGPGLTRKDIQRFLRVHGRELQPCHAEALATTPELRGTLTVEFTVGPEGTVLAATTGESTLANPAVERCMAEVVAGWTLPKPSTGAAVEVTQVFTLTPERPIWTGAGEFVLTRLHARYDASSLGEDLVFEAAAPITGGRELWADGALEQGASAGSSENNFQARYAIRHAWTGARDCEQPNRGLWGAPPDGPRDSQTRAPTLARQRGAARTDGGALGSFVSASAGEQLGVAWLAGPKPGAAPAPNPSKPDAPPEPAAACQCSTNERAQPSNPALPLGLGLLGLLGLVRRASRRPPTSTCG